LKAALQPGDCVNVGALDRLGRSVAEVLDLQGWLRENQVEVGLSLLSAVLGRPHDGPGKRQHDGAHQPARTWGEVRR
jgi:hypothetical protein